MLHVKWCKVILSTLVTSKYPNVTLSAVLHLATTHHLATNNYNDKFKKYPLETFQYQFSNMKFWTLYNSNFWRSLSLKCFIFIFPFIGCNLQHLNCCFAKISLCSWLTQGKRHKNFFTCRVCFRNSYYMICIGKTKWTSEKDLLHHS